MIRDFLFWAVLLRIASLLAGLVMVGCGVFLLTTMGRTSQKAVDVEIDPVEGRIILKGAMPAVVLIVLGGAVIMLAANKTLSFREERPDGTVLTGTGGPTSGLRYLPPLLDTLVRGASASPRGMMLADSAGSQYFPMDFLGRAWAVEAACERTLEHALAGDGELPVRAGEQGVPAPPYFLPAMLDSLVRGAGATRTGFLIDAAGYAALPPGVRDRTRRVIQACENVVTTDQAGHEVLLGRRMRTEGVAAG